MATAPFIAETARLQLREVGLADTAFLHRLLNEPSWLDNIGDRGVHSLADAAGYIRKQIRGPYERWGYGMYLAQLKADATPIGLCGLVKRDFLDHPDLGFALLPDHVGRGYAAEAAGRIIAEAATRWRVAQLYAITKPQNVRSVSLLRRLDFHRERSCPLPQGAEIDLYVRAV